VNYGDLHIPHDMKCASCQHDASDHWVSMRGIIYQGECRGCQEASYKVTGKINIFWVCYEFKWDNLNYIEVMAERREQEKGLV
jgi:hypothetical protein